MIRILLIVFVVVSVIGFLVFHRSHQSGNLVKPITQIGQWNWQDTSPAKAALSAEGDALRCDITEVDGTDWHVQYMFQKITLVEGRQYRIRFNARASRDFVIRLVATNGWSGQDALGLNKEIALIGRWMPYDFTFTAEKTNGRPDRVPIFVMGTAVGTVWIKDVVMEEL
jgi:hypothetical protein